MVIIHVENSCNNVFVPENGLPKSSRDPRYHGFGMRSMERIVEKYNGTLAVKCEGQIFYLDILLFQDSQNSM